MILFDQIVFGPVHSRRLGISLGINLLPIDAKICSFDCLYCECGFNTTGEHAKLPTRMGVRNALELRLKEMANDGQIPDIITFAGNGEPTLHPDFAGIIDDTLELRNKYCPNAKVGVLSNATQIHKPDVFNALKKVDDNILKFDSAFDHTLQLLDRPVRKYITVRWLIEHLKKFEGKMIVQTLFIRGEVNGEKIDNTSDEEIEAWLKALKEMNATQLMIYTIDRETPLKTLEKIPLDELNRIAERAKDHGFDVTVSG